MELFKDPAILHACTTLHFSPYTLSRNIRQIEACLKTKPQNVHGAMGILMHEIVGPNRRKRGDSLEHEQAYEAIMNYTNKIFQKFKVYNMKELGTQWLNTPDHENSGHTGPPKNGLFIANRDPHLNMRDKYREWCTHLQWSLPRFEESITRLKGLLDTGEIEEAIKLVDDELKNRCVQGYAPRIRTEAMAITRQAVDLHIATLFSAKGFDFWKEREMYKYVKRINQNPASNDTNKVFLKQFESVPLLFRASAVKKRYAENNGLISNLRTAADAADAPQRAAEAAKRAHEEQLEQRKQKEAEAEKRRRQQEAAEKKRRDDALNAIWGFGGFVSSMPPIYAADHAFVQPPLYESLRPSVDHTLIKN